MSKTTTNEVDFKNPVILTKEQVDEYIHKLRKIGDDEHDAPPCKQTSRVLLDILLQLGYIEIVDEYNKVTWY